MFPTYDMNPIAIQKMQEERMAAMANKKPLAISAIPPTVGSICVLAIAVIITV
ncbi:hypothetical protein [Marivita sp. XM-24bin2]|jgi:hypothetical protein|uniref:hypothetical protein n=1 Tax=unclassified Marivita TaxID=2632480 RepID=UPI0025BAFDC4|nr:hypothetical protein [Marivita sp. XM-24bin2]MCR9107851.1 hypothetical protein [Paracoccaceae bacterium]